MRRRPPEPQPPPAGPLRLLLVARSLEPGGAERQLLDLIRGLDRTRVAPALALLYDRGELRAEAATIPGLVVTPLGKARRWGVVGPLRRLAALVRASRAQVVYGSLDLANLYALAGGRLGGARVVFGVRSSSMDFAPYGRFAKTLWRLAARASRAADLVIYNSHAGRDFSLAHGFCAANALVIPNGIDTARYVRDAEGGRRVRAEWGLGPRAALVGLVGRLDPMKDHPTFLQAAALVGERFPEARFVCVGGGPRALAEELRALGARLGLEERLVWAGPRRDMTAVYGALDLLALASRGEGFPNVVGEAMACGVPCVVADVGDAARIVGDEGLVVPPGDPAALAAGIARALGEAPGERAARGARCRERIVRQFPLAAMVEATQRALAALAPGTPAPGR